MKVVSYKIILNTAGMILIYFIKITILKKNPNLAILKVNKKMVTVFVSKRAKYIYTEADLGEGKLDEGFIAPGKTAKSTQVSNNHFRY